MPKKELGNKCLVDTVKLFIDENNGEMIRKRKTNIFVEMDGFSWESDEYECLEDFLQAIIDHVYNVSMGKE